MARPISPNRLKALKIWLQSGRQKKPKEIAEELGISSSQVRKWKCIDKWEEIPDNYPKRGAPYRNKNAVGNKGGGAPKGNQNAAKHGLFKKWLPDDDEYLEIYEAARDGMSTLDILWEEILVMFTNFIRAQRIMYVKDHEDMTKVIKKQKRYSDDKATSEEIEYDIQHAWDKQARALTSQAAAMAALSRKIKQYEELIRTLPPEEVKEEHRLRIQKIKADIDAAKQKAW
ncbi:phage terminase small subunit [Fervidibacillus albus]|uniref:Phage terminase small subunit n=1 Tax=Fervidibacillus albus TaxID=2980026 RepID=A0A9E8RWH7_9BACI|nr:phage terminase small subunit [Fervidibacillus albus]WAA10319.1 phage terminase small subunit [Fervidibacillus albus]